MEMYRIQKVKGNRMRVTKQFLLEKFTLNENKMATVAAALGVAGGAMAAPPKEQIPQIDQILQGIGSAEHRGRIKGSVLDYNEKLYIRTGGRDPNKPNLTSTAYGPFQFTRSTVKDLSSRHKDLFSGSEEYVNKFMQQGSKMLKMGENDPTYGFGGKGELSGEESHAGYMDMSRAGLAAMAKDIGVDLSKPLSSEDEIKLVRRFRGVDLSKDKKYWEAYNKGKTYKKPEEKVTTPEEKVTTQEKNVTTQEKNVTTTEISDHTVESGDTLSQIARKYGKKLSDVLQSNPQITNPDQIKPGQKIKLPK